MSKVWETQVVEEWGSQRAYWAAAIRDAEARLRRRFEADLKALQLRQRALEAHTRRAEKLLSRRDDPLVYVGATAFHDNHNLCGWARGVDPKPVLRSEAEERGYTPCTSQYCYGKIPVAN